MNILISDPIKKKLCEKLKNHSCNKKLLIISSDGNSSVKAYRDAILKRADEFNILVDDYRIKKNKNHYDIIDYINGKDDLDSFIVLMPLSEKIDIDNLRNNIKLYDLDCFSYDSCGKIFNHRLEFLPQTARSIIKFLKFYEIKLSGKNIAIANSTNVIGRPLSLALNDLKATVTLLNSKTSNEKKIIKASDIFISAIGKANYFDRSYFRDGQIIIDAGVSFKDKKMYGDVFYEDIEDLDINIVQVKKGIGSITTLSLFESLIDYRRKNE
ncbi:MAG: bifunctional 5,10-methylenetetrahydrofolate dehydrogenase/5,10-methenyltetrahydrofolate cyclohydrolase [Tissierellia bacterium]|nr:bifunctional 5,10-methylenetetrahydrofolate dehydrogenase/5,10-methenyltetrahydrofolate cyclohydrolase [Tissierellia bacterium]